MQVIFFQDIILSRFSGAVTVCDIENMENLLGKKPEFFQGTPRVSYNNDILKIFSNIS
jgi:hypothetical protein